MSQKFTINTKLKSVKTIIHLADIHIRLFKRHQEYDAVFKTLYGLLDKRNLQNTAIVVAGDIVHAKTDMSPEMVRVASEFLKNLADRADTIIIAGNHDLNLANPHRLDALTPIVENLGHERLHYFRDSGVYEFADVQFAVHSIIGDSAEWPSPSEMDNCPKIALYHAPVNKAQTDMGYSVVNKVTVESFNGYDMVLLGDIHRMQILQQKASGLPEIAYPGSLIQQNHGESLENHGFFVWDVSKSSIVEYVEVPNDYGYCTLTIDSTTMPSTSHFPKNTRLRVFVGDVDASFIKKAIATIRKKHDIVELSVNKLVKKGMNVSSSHKSEIDNIHDVTHQNTLIEKYIRTHYSNIDDDAIQKVLDVNTKINTLIGDEELPKNINWRPVNLKFDNLFSYGMGNEINFDGMQGLYGLFSPNATGKTSAFDAMCFALYDKTPRAFKGSHIMNTRRNTFSCTLEIDIENSRYVIERTGIRKKNGEVKVDVNFYRKEDDKIVSLNGEDRRDTNANIRSYVGTYEDFILTTLSVQNQNSLFIDTGQSDRKDLLSQFIGLTVFDRLFVVASDEIKEVQGALKTFKKDDFTQKLADLQNQIDKETSVCVNAHLLIDEALRNIESLSSKIKLLYEQKVPTIVDINPLPIRNEIATLTNQIDKLNTDIQLYLSDIQNCQQKLVELTDIIGNQSLDDLTESILELSEWRNKKTKLESDLRILNSDLQNKLDKLEKLKSHEYDPNCIYCTNNVFVKDARATQKQYDLLVKQLTLLETDISHCNNKIDNLIELETSYKNLCSLFKERESVRNQEEILNLKIDNTKKDIERLKYRMDVLKSTLEQYEANKLLIEQNHKIQSEIDRIEDIKKAFDSDLLKHQEYLRGHDRELIVLKSKRDELLKTIKEAQELETIYEAYETYLTIIGRDGLPYHLIATVIPELETQVNNILSQMVEFTVALEVDGKNINGKIIYDNDRTWPLELASGMEKFISSLAIRVALSSVSNLPKANFLIIDEGLGVLDSENLSSMFMLFDLLKTQFDFIILISHLDVVRDIADNLIEIKRDGGFSYIKVE